MWILPACTGRTACLQWVMPAAACSAPPRLPSTADAHTVTVSCMLCTPGPDKKDWVLRCYSGSCLQMLSPPASR